MFYTALAKLSLALFAFVTGFSCQCLFAFCSPDFTKLLLHMCGGELSQLRSVDSAVLNSGELCHVFNIPYLTPLTLALSLQCRLEAAVSGLITICMCAQMCYICFFFMHAFIEMSSILNATGNRPAKNNLPLENVE